MKSYQMPKFTRAQLEFMVDIILTAAWDRIDAALPSYATNDDELDDWRANEAERRQMIHGRESVVAAALPILYAQLSGDGMGIGDFPEYGTFEAQVEDYIARKTNPQINHADANLVHPDTTDLAAQFVAGVFDEYLDCCPKCKADMRGNVSICPACNFDSSYP
jgi:hypothetical protein